MNYRKLIPNDRFLLEKLIAIDSDHANKSTVDFWTQEVPGKVQSFAVEDTKGPIFYVKSENLARLHMQFDPREKFRTAKALAWFIPNIQASLKGSYRQIIFESTSEDLIRFAERFGYYRSINEVIKDL